MRVLFIIEENMQNSENSLLEIKQFVIKSGSKQKSISSYIKKIAKLAKTSKIIEIKGYGKLIIISRK
jgi:hypothetical protein